MHFRRRVPILVELLDRDLQDLRFAHLIARRRHGAGAIVGDQLDALDDPAAAHLEHLDHRAGGTELDAERVAIAELDARHLLLPRPQRLDRADSVAQLCRLLEPLLRRRF